MDIRKSFKKHLIKIVFLVIGGVGGFMYWKFVGCKTGTCPIKSVWYWSTLYGLVFGYLIGDIVTGYITKRKAKDLPPSEEVSG